MTLKTAGFISQEAAEKWNISRRRVTVLCSQNRITGAIIVAGKYLIPADAKKPDDPRVGRLKPGEPYHFNIRKSLPSDLAEVIAETTLLIPRDDPDLFLASIKEGRIRLLYEGYYAYMRGDFERVVQNFLMLENDDAAKLRACSTVITAAVNLGDYQLFKEIESYCKGMIAANTDAGVTAIAEQALASAYVGAFVPRLVPDWLKHGDFSALPVSIRPDAICSRARYFHFMKEYNSVLDIALTALSFEEQKQQISYMNIFLRILCAAACCSLGRLDDAKKYLTDVMRDCLPHGFITLLALHVPLFGGLIEQLLKRDYPEQYNAVTGLAKRVIPHWLDFHNRFTKDNITTILSAQEDQVALLAAHGKSRAEIAKHQGVSLSRVKGVLEEVYGKLYVSKRSELVKYIL